MSNETQLTEHDMKIESGVENIMRNIDDMGCMDAIANFRGLAGDQGFDTAQCNEVECVAWERYHAQLVEDGDPLAWLVAPELV